MSPTKPKILRQILSNKFKINCECVECFMIFRDVALLLSEGRRKHSKGNLLQLKSPVTNSPKTVTELGVFVKTKSVKYSISC